MQHLKKILLPFLLITLVSCEQGSEKPFDRGDDYLPLKTGNYIVYDVDEIVYTLNVAETLKYELRTLVADSFRNEEGGFTYVVHRSKRSEEESDWQNLDTWSVRKNFREAIVSEGNIPYVVLRFPLSEDLEWNGNLYNSNVHPGTNEPEDFYRVETKGKPYSVNDTHFDDCTVINQEDNQEFIVYYDKRTEVYARGVGLIYKEKNQLRYCTETHCIGQQKVENGIIYKQRVKEIGN